MRRPLLPIIALLAAYVLLASTSASAQSGTRILFEVATNSQEINRPPILPNELSDHVEELDPGKVWAFSYDVIPSTPIANEFERVQNTIYAKIVEVVGPKRIWIVLPDDLVHNEYREEVADLVEDTVPHLATPQEWKFGLIVYSQAYAYLGCDPTRSDRFRTCITQTLLPVERGDWSGSEHGLREARKQIERHRWQQPNDGLDVVVLWDKGFESFDPDFREVSCEYGDTSSSCEAHLLKNMERTRLAGICWTCFDDEERQMKQARLATNGKWYTSDYIDAEILADFTVLPESRYLWLYGLPNLRGVSQYTKDHSWFRGSMEDFPNWCSGGGSAENTVYYYGCSHNMPMIETHWLRIDTQALECGGCQLGGSPQVSWQVQLYDRFSEPVAMFYPRPSRVNVVGMESRLYLPRASQQLSWCPYGFELVVGACRRE